MEKIEYKDRNDLERYIEEHKVKYLGSGIEGSCYLLDDGITIKVLFEERTSEDCLKFKDIENPSFVFARNAGFINGNIVALFTEYVEGNSLVKHIPSEQKIITLGEQLQELVNDIKSLSDLNITVKDFHCDNIIYDNEKFTIIDTDGYTCDDKNNEKSNIREIMTKIYGTLLFQIIRYEEIRREFISYGKIELLENPLHYSQKLTKLICDLTEENIETVDDANKVLKKKFKTVGVSRKNM